MNERAVEAENAAVCSIAQRRSSGGDCVEHRGEVAGRGIDDLQHLGGRSLLIQCLACLGQEPRALHRGDSLGREVLQQCDLSVGKRPHLLPLGADITEHRLILPQRHEQHGADTRNLGSRAPHWMIFPRGRHLRTIEDLTERLAAEQ